jgi:hypothetical protein
MSHLHFVHICLWDTTGTSEENSLNTKEDSGVIFESGVCLRLYFNSRDTEFMLSKIPLETCHREESLRFAQKALFDCSSHT